MVRATFTPSAVLITGHSIIIVIGTVRVMCITVDGGYERKPQ